MKMYYAGRVLVDDCVLGHKLLKIKEKKILKELNFTDKRRFGLGGLCRSCGNKLAKEKNEN